MEKEILYQFISMELVQFATFEDCYVENDEDIEITNKFQFSYNFVENVMCCTSSVSLSKESRNFLKADLASYFGIEPSSAESLKESEDFIAPPELLAQFASLTYGSIRGVIFAKTMSTALNNIILPPNDVRNLFQTSQRFKRT